MFASVLTALIIGLDVHPVRVEADVRDGLPSFNIVGFPSAQVREAQDRVRTALYNIDIRLPPKRITVNLAPADIRKEGASFDLPVAVAVLAASGILPASCLEGVMIMGELGLNGDIHGTKGVLPRVMLARDQNCRYCLIPSANLEEGCLVPHMQVMGADNLMEAIACLCNPDNPELLQRSRTIIPFSKPSSDTSLSDSDIPSLQSKPDFADIRGQQPARKAAEIAASGYHNLLMIGPPGSGKTMIARRIPSILPSLTFEECLELTRIYSIAGLLSEKNPLVTERPFRSPHHTATAIALAGGGRIPTPGEVTLAQKGVLFLDEMTEYSRDAIEIIRQPLEDRFITISRVAGTFRFPANFMLVAATNPCPCGMYPGVACICTRAQISQYLGKISQPLLDRIDLCTDVSEISFDELTSSEKGESSSSIRKRVAAAHQIQMERYQKESFSFNGEMPGNRIEAYCPLTRDARMTLSQAFRKISFSARSYHRILKTSRTIADLEGSEMINSAHVCEALSYRPMETRYWNI